MRSKPYNMKYTDLCIYVDNTIYERDENNNPIGLKTLTPSEIDNVYTYLYHIIYALSVKKRLLFNAYDYDAFSTDMAGTLYLRLTDSNQDWNNSGEGKKPIKSVLNYIKSCIGFLAVDFRNKNYSEIYGPDHYDDDVLADIQNYMRDQVQEDYNRTIDDEIVECLTKLPSYIDDILEASIYKKSKYSKNVLKFSIMICLLKCFNLNNKLKRNKKNKQIKELYKQLDNMSDYIEVWNKEDIAKPYIEILIKKIIKKLNDSINEIQNENLLSEETIDDILSSALSTYGLNQGDNE